MTAREKNARCTTANDDVDGGGDDVSNGDDRDDDDTDDGYIDNNDIPVCTFSSTPSSNDIVAMLETKIKREKMVLANIYFHIYDMTL